MIYDFYVNHRCHIPPGYKPNICHCYLCNVEVEHQGLTQTFLSSGPQDHQLRESGGPTIFLVVLRIKSRHTNSYAYIIKKS